MIPDFRQVMVPIPKPDGRGGVIYYEPLRIGTYELIIGASEIAACSPPKNLKDLRKYATFEVRLMERDKTVDIRCDDGFYDLNAGNFWRERLPDGWVGEQVPANEVQALFRRCCEVNGMDDDPTVGTNFRTGESYVIGRDPDPYAEIARTNEHRKHNRGRASRVP